MARCKECLHYEVCAKEGRLVQVDEHTWDEYNKLDDVEQFCTNYFTADVAPRADVAREIFEEIENDYADFLFDGYRNIVVLTEKDFAELKKKHTEDLNDGKRTDH